MSMHSFLENSARLSGGGSPIPAPYLAPLFVFSHYPLFLFSFSLYPLLFSLFFSYLVSFFILSLSVNLFVMNIEKYERSIYMVNLGT